MSCLSWLSSGTIVANITAEDPDDKGFTGFLLYSITTANRYFVINQRKSHTHTRAHTHTHTHTHKSGNGKDFVKVTSLSPLNSS